MAIPPFSVSLEGKLRDVKPRNLVRVSFHIDFQGQAAAEAVVLDGVIIVDVVKLRRDRHQPVQIGNGVTKEGSKSLRHICHRIYLVDKGFAADAFQRIVEKMGIDLVLQRQVLGLLFQNLHLPAPIGGFPDGLVKKKLGGIPDKRAMHQAVLMLGQKVIFHVFLLLKKGNKKIERAYAKDCKESSGRDEKQKPGSPAQGIQKQNGRERCLAYQNKL